MAPALDSLKSHMKERFDQSTMKGQFNTESNHIINRDRDPSATTPEPGTAPVAQPMQDTSNASRFSENASSVTGAKLGNGDTSIDLRRPPQTAINAPHFALQA